MENHQLMGKLMAVLRMHRRAVESRLAQSGIGLHQAQHRLLMCLSKERCQSQVGVAKHLDVSPATIAVSMKKLERDGLIYRVSREEDNRFNCVELSEKGKQIVAESQQVFIEMDELIFKGVTESEKEQFVTILDKMYVNMER